MEDSRYELSYELFAEGLKSQNMEESDIPFYPAKFIELIKFLQTKFDEVPQQRVNLGEKYNNLVHP